MQIYNQKKIKCKRLYIRIDFDNIRMDFDNIRKIEKFFHHFLCRKKEKNWLRKIRLSEYNSVNKIKKLSRPYRASFYSDFYPRGFALMSFLDIP
jgi:hypothetical protein